MGAIVHQSLAFHARTRTCRVQQFGGAGLEYTRSNSREHVVTAFAFKHDCVDTLTRQQLTQQQARGTATDDRNLGAHGFRVSAHTTNFANLHSLSMNFRRKTALMQTVITRCWLVIMSAARPLDKQLIVLIQNLTSRN
jgi:hypothetical protein